MLRARNALSRFLACAGLLAMLPAAPALAQGKTMAEAREIVKARRIQCIMLSPAQLEFLNEWRRR